MGFTASYGSCSFYCTVNGTYTITKRHMEPQRAQKQKNLNSYIITYTYYWYKTLGDTDAQWQKTQELICAKIPANIYSVIYAKVKLDISPNYTVEDL